MMPLLLTSPQGSPVPASSLKASLPFTAFLMVSLGLAGSLFLLIWEYAQLMFIVWALYLTAHFPSKPTTVVLPLFPHSNHHYSYASTPTIPTSIAVLTASFAVHSPHWVGSSTVKLLWVSECCYSTPIWRMALSWEANLSSTPLPSGHIMNGYGMWELLWDSIQCSMWRHGLIFSASLLSSSPRLNPWPDSLCTQKPNWAVEGVRRAFALNVANPGLITSTWYGSPAPIGVF